MGNTSIQTQSYRAVDKDAGQSRSYIIPFALLCSLFFLWAVANNLNDILLPQFQQAFTLTNFQAGLIQSAFYFGYFIIPIPAGILMKKLSYKAGIITGLFLYALGAALFWPAAEIMNYTLFLVGLFIIAAGLGCLETAANPFVTVVCYERCIFDLDDYQKAIDRSRCKLHHPQAPIIRPLYSQFITRQEWKGIFLNVAWIVLSVLIVLGVILNYQADRRKA